MKLLFVGNSHLGAFRLGWKVLAPHCPTVSANFYPDWRRYYHLFQEDVATGRIHMTSEPVRQKFAELNGGDGSFKPLDYDICIIVGGGDLWHGLPGGRYSKQLRTAVTWDYINNLHHTVLLRKIRAVSDIPVLIVPNPFMASRDQKPLDYLPPHDFGAAQANAILQPALDATILTQPAETVLFPRVARLEFAVGERLVNLWPGAPSPPFLHDDMCHMNGAFGTLYLREILRSLGQNIGDVDMPPAEGALPFADKTTPPGV